MTVRTRKTVLEFIQTPEPTPYQVRDLATGEAVYVRCAMDAPFTRCSPGAASRWWGGPQG